MYPIGKAGTMESMVAECNWCANSATNTVILRYRIGDMVGFHLVYGCVKHAAMVTTDNNVEFVGCLSGWIPGDTDEEIFQSLLIRGHNF